LNCRWRGATYAACAACRALTLFTSSMIDITVQNFEAELVHGSIEQPVLLDIWAPWCGPCKTLGPVLEKLEVAYAGRFRLGKLNSDEQPEIAGQLSQMFGVRSIPFCVLFKEGQPIDGFVGALPEAQVRQFLDKHVPSADEMAAEEEVDEAQALLAAGDTDSALERLQEAVAIDPANDAARYDYLRALLTVGRVEDARRAFDPVAGKLLLDPRLAAAGLWLEACEHAPTARPPEALAAAIAANKRDFDARYELAQKHFAALRFTEAMDELLEIVMRDKTWRDELARKTYVAILELMTKPAPKPAAAEAKGTLEVAGKASVAPADPLLDQYRRKLSMALF
jgi:putative thioredoxin